ncbi:19051_t:CDS:1, partial [Racocetra persica]
LEEEIVLRNNWITDDNIKEIKCLNNYTYLFRNEEDKSTTLKNFMCDCYQASIDNIAKIACEESI